MVFVAVAYFKTAGCGGGDGEPKTKARIRAVSAVMTKP